MRVALLALVLLIGGATALVLPRLAITIWLRSMGKRW